MNEKINFDRGTLKVIETREGFLKAKVTVARPGVFEYIEDDKIIYQAKLPQDIFSKTTIDSLKGIPVTDDHPQIEGQYILLNSNNYKDFSKGNISEPFIEDGKLCAYETIWDSELIKEIKDGKKREVSIGFTHECDLIPGEYEGQKYDFAQTNIVINHLAHVDKGRAGSDVKIHFDKKYKEYIMDNKNNVAVDAGVGTSDNKTYSYRKFDGSKDIAVSQEIHSELMLLRNEIKENQSKFDEYDKKIKDLENEKNLNQKEDEIKSLHETIDGWKKQFNDLKVSIPTVAQEMANERAELLDFAKSIDIAVDGLTNKEIKLQIIAKGLPFGEGIKIDSIDNSVIDARFDASKELIKEKANMSQVKIDTSDRKKSLQDVWEGGK